MRLRAVGRYVNEPRGVAYNAGDVFEADAATAAFLLADAPGTFEIVTNKAVAAPPADKAVRTPDKAK